MVKLFHIQRKIYNGVSSYLADRFSNKIDNDYFVKKTKEKMIFI